MTVTSLSLEQRIAERSPSLSPTERRVAQFLVDHQEEIAFVSAVEIARQADTSDATVVRTAQALGYAGLPELKRELLEALRSKASPALRLGRTLERLGNDPELVLDHVLVAQIEQLEDARRTIRPEQFRAAVELLRSAERTLIYGNGPLRPLADYFTLRLRRFGRPADALTRTGRGLADDLLGIQRGDVVVVMTYARVDAEVQVLLVHTRSVGARVVLLTDTLAGALGEWVDVALSARSGPEDMWRASGTTLILIDALLFGLAARNRSRTLASLEELKRLRGLIADSRPGSSPQFG